MSLKTQFLLATWTPKGQLPNILHFWCLGGNHWHLQLGNRVPEGKIAQLGWNHVPKASGPCMAMNKSVICWVSPSALLRSSLLFYLCSKAMGPLQSEATFQMRKKKCHFRARVHRMVGRQTDVSISTTYTKWHISQGNQMLHFICVTVIPHETGKWVSKPHNSGTCENLDVTALSWEAQGS